MAGGPGPNSTLGIPGGRRTRATRVLNSSGPGPNAQSVPEAAVRDLLRATDLLGEVPVPVVRIAAALRIRVVETAFTESGLAGLIVVDAAERTIYVSRSDPPARQRFTIAHELGHFWMHMRSGDVRGFKDFGPQLAFRSDNNLTALEREANAFAAELLMPRAQVRQLARQGLLADDVQRYFEVSHEAASIRLQQTTR